VDRKIDIAISRISLDAVFIIPALLKKSDRMVRVAVVTVRTSASV
jgi:hypothetical protein